MRQSYKHPKNEAPYINESAQNESIHVNTSQICSYHWINGNLSPAHLYDLHYIEHTKASAGVDDLICSTYYNTRAIL